MNYPLGPVTLALLALPALALTVARRMFFGRTRDTSGDPMQIMLSVASTIMFVMAALGSLVGMIGMWILFVPLPLALIVLILMVVDRTRRAEHRGLIWALAAAANRGIPLPEAARAFADETPGNSGKRATKLAQALEQGQSLAAAGRSARLRMGTAMRLTVRMAESLGMLGPAMRQQLDDSQQIDATLRDAFARLFYLSIVIVFMVAVHGFVMLKIIPVYQMMFREFGVPLPEVTNLLINGSNWFVRGGWVPLLPILAAVVPIVLVIGVLYYTGWLSRDFPLWWGLSRRYDGALVMRGLALAIRRGLPIDQAMNMLANSYPLSIVGSRLQTAAERVAAGGDWCQSLKQTGLIAQADAAVLAAAQRAGNLEWALEEMAGSALRRQAQRVQVLTQLLFPIALLLVGACAFVFVCGLFVPLIRLIEGLA